MELIWLIMMYYYRLYSTMGLGEYSFPIGRQVCFVCLATRQTLCKYMAADTLMT